MSERRGGFALLMVLVALAMLATVLTLRTRQMMERSLVWDAQAREVQTRWAQRTVAQSLAPQALSLLGMDKQSQKARRRPWANWATTMVLGPVAVQVHVSDEQAKLNLHTLSEEDDAIYALQELLGSSMADRIRLRPLEVGFQSDNDSSDFQDDASEFQDDISDLGDDAPADDDAPVEGDDSGQDDEEVRLVERPGQYLSFGQVFDHPSAGELMGEAAGRGLAARWTLWGDGRLNVKTVDPVTLRVMLTFGVDDVRNDQILVALRQKHVSLKRLFDTLPRYHLEEEDQYAMNRLTEGSKVQGLWVRARSVGSGSSNGGANESAAFYVIEGADRPRRVQTW